MTRSPRLVPALLLAAALALVQSIFCPGGASAQTCLPDPGPKYQPIPGLDSSAYPVCYQPPNDANKASYTALQARHLLETYSQFLSPLRLPHPLRLVALNCETQYGTDSPFYNRDDRSLNFCYEWVGIVRQWSPAQPTPEGVTRANVVAGMWAGTLLHETGHAMFDMLDVPVFGREEDAADQIAAFIALQFSKDLQITVIKGFAYFWQMAAKEGNDPPTATSPNPPADAMQRCFADPVCAYSDEHGTASQRLYNALCLAYGADPATFGDFVSKGWLPKSRAPDCAREYRQLALAFSKTILPFIDPQARAKVQSVQWLLPDELK